MSEKESLESRRKDVNERRVRMELRQATARSISTAGCVFFILWLVVFPISAAAMFTWGGVYAAKVVPLNNAADAIMAAEGYVPYAPSAIINNTPYVWGLVDWAKLQDLPESAQLHRIEASDLSTEGHGIHSALRHPSWSRDAWVQTRFWQQGLFLAKTLSGGLLPAEYWTDHRGHLFLRVTDGRGVELAVAIAPSEMVDRGQP